MILINNIIIFKLVEIFLTVKLSKARDKRSQCAKIIFFLKAFS